MMHEQLQENIVTNPGSRRSKREVRSIIQKGSWVELKAMLHIEFRGGIFYIPRKAKTVPPGKQRWGCQLCPVGCRFIGNLLKLKMILSLQFIQPLPQVCDLRLTTVMMSLQQLYPQNSCNVPANVLIDLGKCNPFSNPKAQILSLSPYCTG